MDKETKIGQNKNGSKTRKEQYKYRTKISQYIGQKSQYIGQKIKNGTKMGQKKITKMDKNWKKAREKGTK